MAHRSRPFRVDVDADALADLRLRLERTRWPDGETQGGWDQGTPLAYAQELAAYWRDTYDWRRVESLINRWPQEIVDLDIDGEALAVHCIHRRSPRPDARALLLTHGWPGSVLEFYKVIDALAEPEDPAAEAFHVIVPSLPGYGFSASPQRAGTTVQCIADLWNALMGALGYERYLAQGGDWGSMVTRALALRHPGHCRGIHLNMIVAPPTPETMDDLTEAEQAYLARLNEHLSRDTGYARIQSTRPQSLAYGLADSPAGQMAWIVEKYAFWSDCVVDGKRHPEHALSRDELLDQISWYWLTNTAGSSARLYWESYSNPDLTPVEVPMGGSLFPVDIFPTSERWARALFPKMVYWNQPERGGHFAALEEPEQFVRELRQCFRCMPWT